MKKQFTIFLFILVNFAVNAQDQKEAKEKLAAYIKEYYAVKKVITINSANSQDYEGKSYDNFIIEFSKDNTIMSFSYNYQFDYNSVMTDVKDLYTIKNKIVLDFSTIESVAFQTVNTLNKDKQFFVLNFKTKPNNTILKYSSEKDKNIPEIPEKVNEIAIPVNTNFYEDNNFKDADDKILQNFDELIKLCKTN